MIRTIITSGLICIFLCAGYSTKAQDIFNKADSLYHSGNDTAAVIAYERCYFDARDQSTGYEALIRKADVYKNFGEFEKAIFTLERIALESISDSLAEQLRYELIINNYLAGNFREAESYLIRFEDKGAEDTLSLVILNILVLNELLEWERSKKAIEELAKHSKAENDSLFNLINEHYQSKNIPKLKKEQKAEIMSKIIPGSGQIYAGYPFEGTFNLLLHAAALAGGIHQVWNEFYLTGYFAGAGMFTKLYMGAPRRISLLVQKTNYRRTREFNSRAKELVLQMYDKLKNY